MEGGMNSLTSLVQSWLRTSKRSFPSPVVTSPRPDRLGLGASNPSKLANEGKWGFKNKKYIREVAKSSSSIISSETDDCCKSTILSTREKKAKNSRQPRNSNKQKSSSGPRTSSTLSVRTTNVESNVSSVALDSNCDFDGVMVSCSHPEKICAKGCGQLLRGGSSSFRSTNEESKRVAVPLFPTTQGRRGHSKLRKHRSVKLLQSRRRVELIERVYRSRLYYRKVF